MELIKAASTHLPTEYGVFEMVVFHESQTQKEQIALIFGELDVPKPVLTRVHSECITGESFHSLKCGCKWQLDTAMRQIAERGSGIIIYLKEEGRGIGLTNKIKAYALQEQGMDTVEANLALGLKADARDYKAAVALLKEYGIHQVELLTNNPAKVSGLEEGGIAVTKRIPIEAAPNRVDHDYLATKKEKLGHILTSV